MLDIQLVYFSQSVNDYIYCRFLAEILNKRSWEHYQGLILYGLKYSK